MAITLKDGGQAFPRPAAWSPSGMTGSSAESGMSMRQYYAAHAPAAPDWFRFETDNLPPTVPSVPQGWDTEQRAEFLMIKEGSIDEACAKLEVREFWRIYSPARAKLEVWRMDMRKRKFFAWRWFFADMMIATNTGHDAG